MAANTYRVLIDFDGDYRFTEPLADISDTLQTVKTRLGVDFDSSIYPQSIAGQMLVECVDVQNRFNPASATAQIAPGLPIKLVMTVSDVDYNIWEGYIQNFVYDDTIDSKIKRFSIEAYGIIGLLSESTFELTPTASRQSKQLWTDVLDSIELPTFVSQTLGDSFSTLGLWLQKGTNTLDNLREIERSENGLMREAQAGNPATHAPKLVFESSGYRKGISKTPSHTFSDVRSPDSTQMSKIVFNRQQPSQFRDVTLQVNSFDVETSNIVSTNRPTDLIEGGSGDGYFYLDSPEGTAASRIDFKVKFDETPYGVQSWNSVLFSGSRLSDFGDPSGSWRRRGSFRSGVGAPVGSVWYEFLETSSDSATIRLHNPLLGRYRSSGATRNEWIRVERVEVNASFYSEADDPTIVRKRFFGSSDRFQRHRSYLHNVSYLSDVNAANAYAESLIERHRDTHLRPTISFIASGDTDALLDAATVDISKLVRLKSSAHGDRDYFIENISHRIRRGVHEVNLGLSPVPAALPDPSISNFRTDSIGDDDMTLAWDFSGIAPSEFTLTVVGPSTTTTTHSVSGYQDTFLLEGLRSNTLYRLQLSWESEGETLTSAEIERRTTT